MLSILRKRVCHFTTTMVQQQRAAASSLGYIPDPVSPEDMPYLHHGKRPRFRDYEKFKSPHKRASKMMMEIRKEAIEKSKRELPKVWEENFRPGDAIEIEQVSEGSIHSDKTETVRGVVIGIFRKHLDFSVLIRDVLFGEPIERRIPLHSPLVRSLKILQKNFIHKGKKRVKRAKLYYLEDENLLLCQVTKKKKKAAK